MGPRSRVTLRLSISSKDAISTAHSHYTLGGLYVATNRLDDAEKHLAIAVRIRNADVVGPTFMAVVYEMKGDLVAAKQMRKLRPNSDNVPGALYVLRAVPLCLNTNITCRGK